VLEPLGTPIADVVGCEQGSVPSRVDEWYKHGERGRSQCCSCLRHSVLPVSPRPLPMERTFLRAYRIGSRPVRGGGAGR